MAFVPTIFGYSAKQNKLIQKRFKGNIAAVATDLSATWNTRQRSKTRSSSSNTHLKHHHAETDSHPVADSLRGDIAPDAAPVSEEPGHRALLLLARVQHLDVSNLALDGADFGKDVRVVGRKLPKVAQILHGALSLALLEEEARGLADEEEADEKDAGRDELSG